jgi:thiamine pyrophosphate-dependent acetolactate synthase large subunit-like protein
MPIYKPHERIVELFQAEGIDTLFGIPDPSFFAMFITAEAKGMRVVAPHHEQAGALMADAMYRMTGKPGVICLNKGPGVANAVNGAIYMQKENVPAVFVLAQRQRLYEERVRRGKMQYNRQRPFYENVMKYSGVVEYPQQLDEVFREAFRVAQSGVPGPTSVEIPLSIMQAQLDLPPALAPNRYRLTRQRAGDDVIAEAAALLKGAAAPILLIGQGVFVSRAHEAVAALARKAGATIVFSTAVEAVIDGMEDRSFPYGCAAASEAVAKADVVVAIGTEIGEPLHYGRGRHWTKGHPDRKWVYVERDPTAIGVNRPIDVPLVGDLRDIVPQLTEALGDRQRDLPGDVADWAKAHVAEKAAQTAAIPATSQPIHPGRLAIEATKALSRDTVFVRDGGASSMWFQGLLQYAPRDAMWNSNYGAVGPGLPYAVGAQLAVGPRRRVVLVTGDSSMLFHIAELETAVRFNLPIVCIVAVDHCWGIEAASYRANFGNDTPIPGAPWSTAVRFDKTAESFGAHGEYVERAEDIAAAVERAFASGKPAVVHVVVDKDANGSFAGVPGFAEFRTWYGEEGDNLADASAPAQPTKLAPMDSGSGY